MERTGIPGLAPAPAIGRAAVGMRRLRHRLEPLTVGRAVAERWCEAAVYVASLAAAWAFAAFALRRHEQYYSTAYDFGFFDQIIWNTSRGRWFETSFVDYNFFGQHMEPVLILFAGGYRLGAGPESLLIVQAMAAAAAAIPLFYAARAIGGSAISALLIATAFLLNPSLHRALDFDFHPELLGFPFVFSALYFAQRMRPMAAAAAILPVLMLKEDMAAVVVVFGVLVWARGRRRHGGALIATGVAWAIATAFVVMPLVRGGGSDLNERFQYLTADTTRASILPVAAWRGSSQLWTETAPALASMVMQTAGIALAHPAFILVLPSAFLNGLADHGPQSRLDLQYATAPLALLFASGALALGPLSRRRLRNINLTALAASIAVAGAGVSFVVSSPYSPAARRYAPTPEHRAAIAEAFRLIPAGANVSAQNTLLPHLSQRPDVYEFPHVREDTEIVVVDVNLPITSESHAAGYDRWLAELPAWGFEEVFARDGVRLFRRDVRP